MRAESTGRKLGIGLRLAARAMQQRTAQAQPVPPNRSGRVVQVVSDTAQAAVKAPVLAKGIGRGARRFGEAVWGPMAHTGSVLWLEITGLFFALFAAFFAQNVYKFRAAYRTGPDHAHFLVYSALTALFAVFTISQFYKARQKEKKNRARRSAIAEQRAT